MAKPRIDMETTPATVLEDDRDELIIDGKEPEEKADPDSDLVSWVVARTDEWRTHRKTNYEADWERFERLWRGIWSGQEKERQSERSKIVTPALGEAVENGAAEIEEAVFGRGDFFDFKPEARDDENARRALEHNKNALREDLSRAGFSLQVSEVIVNGAVYGLGVAEIVQETLIDREIVPITTPDGTVIADVIEKEIEAANPRSVNPRNLLWDPSARNVADGLGIAIEENVGLHLIYAGQESGDYLECEIEAAEPEDRLDTDPQKESRTSQNTGHVLRYYGLVPEHLLFPPEKVEDLSEDGTPSEEPGKTDMVEAVVVIINKKGLLKAVENPSLMKDRPVTIFKWDVIPGRLPGRGVCEKGEVPQRMLDSEMRSRMDALAYISAPMMAMDATRLPRGFNFQIAPGKSILVSGDPATALKPFTFGQLDQNTWNQAAALDQMVQRATGSLNMNQMAQSAAGGDARSGAVSMSLAGIVKRSKRTLLHFIDGFFIPTLEKVLWRNMQLRPDRYIPMNSSFTATTAMGIMQREYEMLTLTQLLSTMQPGTKEQKTLLMGVVANTGLNNRAQIINMLEESVAQEMKAAQMQLQGQPVDPLEAQLREVTIQLAIAEKQAKIRKLNADAGLAEAQTQSEMVEPQIQAREAMLKGIYEVPQAAQAAEFDKRMRLAETFLEKADIESNERIARTQAAASIEKERIAAAGKVAAAQTAGSAEVAAARVPPPPPQPIGSSNLADVEVARADAAQEAARAAQQEEKRRIAALKALSGRTSKQDVVY